MSTMYAMCSTILTSEIEHPPLHPMPKISTSKLQNYCMYLLPRCIHFVDNVFGIVVAAQEGCQDGAIIRCVAARDTSRLPLSWFDGVGNFYWSIIDHTKQ